MEDELTHRVMNISINPKSSFERHKAHSRLNNFHSLDYDEEMFIDLSYCDRSVKGLLSASRLPLKLTDFNNLLASYQGKTSTPFKDVLCNYKANLDVALKTVKPVNSLHSSVEDSGFSESLVASSFAASCVINSVEQKGKRSRHETNSESDHDEFSHLPLPCISLEFNDVDSDHSNDSLYLDQLQKAREDNCQGEELSGNQSPAVQNTSVNFTGEAADKNSNTPIVPLFSHDEQTRFDRVLKQHSPPDPQRVIGRKMGLVHVDIIGELHERRVLPVLDALFDRLPDADLCSLCCVSRSWSKAVTMHQAVNRRRLTYIRSKHAADTAKENAKTAQSLEDRGLAGASIARPFGVLQPTAALIKPSSPEENIVSKYDLFVKAASGLKSGETLRKCPKCLGPAPVSAEQERARCTNVYCEYDFCIRCRCAFHGSKDCALSVSKKSKHESSAVTSTAAGHVGSRKSKQALKRL